MERPIPSSENPPPELHGLDPGELLARGLDTVKPSAGMAAWEPPTPEELGRLLTQYRIESLIGRGGMGAVYKGTQIVLDRPVAIKLLPAEIAADEQFIARFHREARTLAKLQHSRIITIHDFGQTSEGHLYFVMEYIDGTDLRKILRGPGLSPEQALLVVGQICDALNAAHAQGVIHRDIKPENILVTKNGYVKLADFGLARPLKQEDVSALTGTHVIMGTADYMAPEQREGQADERADIFALGVMLYEMLTGKPPRGAFEPASRKVRLDVRIDEVVLRALQAEPERRYQRISDMKTDVDRIRNTPLPEPAPAPAEPPRPVAPARKQKKSKAPLFAAAIGALLVGIAGYFVWMKSGHPLFNRWSGASGAITATREAPFVNTLGMKFVPVPGADAFFCVWETRVRDYAQFANNNGNTVDTAWTAQLFEGLPVSREPDYPVAGVSWHDANAFCKWLAEKEISAGRLPKNAVYRLPTDLEWSASVGLAKEEGAAPRERHEKNKSLFPWGVGFPPPRNRVGNYADESMKAAIPSKTGIIRGYTDGFAASSPVGSFEPNGFGLYDLSGNVWEWCEDLWEPGSDQRVLRGGCYNDPFPEPLRLSYRARSSPNTRSAQFGFRCVLTTAAPAGHGTAFSVPPMAGASTPVSVRASAPSPSPHASRENEELAKALLSSPWTWDPLAPESFPWTKVVFWTDGTMTLWKDRAMAATPANTRWTVTGPRSVTLEVGARDRFFLTFFFGLDYFTGSREGGKAIVNGRKIYTQEASPTKGGYGAPPPAFGTPARATPSQAAAENPPRSPDLAQSRAGPVIAQSTPARTQNSPAFTPPKTAAIGLSSKPRLLFLTYSAGFQHSVVKRTGDGYSLAEQQLSNAAAGQFQVEPTQNCGVINAANLENYAAVAFYTSGELPIRDEDRLALLSYVGHGGGFVGIHSAADTFHNFSAYSEMLGGEFSGHPGNQKMRVRVDDKTFTATSHLGDGFSIQDEPYSFRRWDRARLHVLLSFDPNSVAKKPDKPNTSDYAAAWTRSYGQGRVFYTALGHNEEEWRDERFLRMVVNGARWAMGPNVPAGSAAGTSPAAYPAEAGNAELAKVLLSHGWTWTAFPDSFPWKEVVFWSDGTMTTSTQTTARWTVTGPRSVALQFGGGDRILLTFYSGLDYFTGSRDGSKVIVSGRKTGSRDAPVPKAATIPVNAPPANAALPKPATKQTFGSFQEEALLGYNWSWDPVKENGSHPVVQFLRDGRVSAGWHWQWLPKSNGELVVDCFWGAAQHLFLKFNKQFSEFEAYGEAGGCQVRGKRLAPVGQTVETH